MQERAGIGMTSARTRERLVQRLKDQGIEVTKEMAQEMAKEVAQDLTQELSQEVVQPFRNRLQVNHPALLCLAPTALRPPAWPRWLG